MRSTKLFVPAGTFLQLSSGSILELVQPNLLNSAFWGSGPPSRNSGLVMVNGWSVLLEANALWDDRESESRRDRARRPSTSIPVATRTRIFPGRGFAKRLVMRIIPSFLLLALYCLLPVCETAVWRG